MQISVLPARAPDGISNCSLPSGEASDPPLAPIFLVKGLPTGVPIDVMAGGLLLLWPEPGELLFLQLPNKRNKIRNKPVRAPEA